MKDAFLDLARILDGHVARFDDVTSAATRALSSAESVYRSAVEALLEAESILQVLKVDRHVHPEHVTAIWDAADRIRKSRLHAEQTVTQLRDAAVASAAREHARATRPRPEHGG